MFTNKKKKIKQNSDDITKSGVIKRILKQKPNSFGGCPSKIIENKIFTNIIKEFRRDLEKNQTLFYSSINNKPKVKQTNTNNLFPSNPLSSNQNSISPTVTNSAQIKIIDQSNSKLNFSNEISIHNAAFSEKDSTATQETILCKPDNFSITNSFSNNQSNSISNSLLNTSSLKGFEHLLGTKNNSETNNNATNITGIKDDSLSRSSIIFQPHRDFKSSPNNSQNTSNSSKYISSNPLVVLKFHLDSVRDVFIEPNNKILTSIGEDSCICFWDLDKVVKHYKDPEPFLTFRIFTSPIFTITGPRKVSQEPFVAYTSGIDGIIRPFFLPDIKQQRNNETIEKCCSLLPWRAHQDMIWQLNYHPKEFLMSSVSSDGTVKIFKTYESNQQLQQKQKHFYSYDSSSTKNLVRTFVFRNRFLNIVEIPTSSAWNEVNPSTLYVSHIASYIRVYDIETGDVKGEISYDVEKNIPYESQQANKILYFNDSTLISGHEDRQFRIFDIKSNKMVNNFVAHADSISCLCHGFGEYELLSASHDGTVRCWDLRGGNNKLIFDIPAHRKKYDEGCLSLNIIKNDNLIITSGADGIIKVFKM